MSRKMRENTSNMDRVVTIPFWKKRFVVLSTLCVLTLGVLLWIFYASYRRQQIPILAQNEITLEYIGKVQFQDTVNVRATFEPYSTTYIDSGVVGTITSIHVSNGAIVDIGDPIISLSNPQIDAQILTERGQISDRLSTLDNRDLDLQKSLISRRSEIETITFDNLKAQRELDQNTYLHNLDLVSDAAIEEARAKLTFQQERLKLAKENLKIEEKHSSEYIERNQDARRLANAQFKSLTKRENSLNVRASRPGIITGLDLTLGQQVTQGMRIAAIGDSDKFRLSATVDEFYTDQIGLEIKGTATFNNEEHPVFVSDIRPTVTDGQFSIKLDFDDQLQMSVRQGQSVNVALFLSSEAGLLAIARDTYDALPDKQKVYVMDEERRSAILTPIRYGRKNIQHVEIISGVRDGDVIISKHISGLSKAKIRIN